MAELSAQRWADGWWTNEGLRLHYRDYAGDPARPPVIVLPGLTRNARDHAGLAERLAGRWRVLAVELRGRGESGWADDPASYVPLTYLQDLAALFAALKLERAVLVGTSLGGILTMLLAATAPDKVAAAVLNDIGPEIDPAGLERIRGYVGSASRFADWDEAARAVAASNADVYPAYGAADWLAMARRLCRESGGGIVFDYDPKIAEPFRVPGNEAAPDMWPAFEALRGKPVLVVRGERSDILSAATAAAMSQRLDGCELVTVPGVGHTPTLEEPEALTGIERLLKRVAA